MEKIKQFFAAPTDWQRLALLSILSMFISHLILLSSQGPNSNDGIDIFAVVAGAAILLFVIGWSALNGSSSTKFVSRSIGVVCASFEIHRLVYSFIWPKKLNEIEEPTFQIFAVVLIVGLMIQSLTGKSASDFLVLIKEKANVVGKIKLPRMKPKVTVVFPKANVSETKTKTKQ